MQTKNPKEPMLRKKEETLSGPDVSPRFPWLILSVLTTTNFLLSYGALSTPLKIAFFILGLLLPLGIWVAKTKATGMEGEFFHRREFLNPLPLWILVLLVGAAFGLRFWKITSLFLWPTGDEALHAQVGLNIIRGESFHFFNTVGQNPPALFWICGLFFKLFRNPFFDLWFPPALLSLLTLAAGYFTVRRFTSRSFSFLYAGLLAFSYWPLYLGRICVEGIVVPLAEFITLFLLGKFLQTSGASKTKWAFWFGLSVGVHSFTFVAWPVVVLAFSAFFLFEFQRLKDAKAEVMTAFLGGLGIALVPFLIAAIQTGYGQHIFKVAFWSSAWGGGPIQVVLNYLAVLGWGVSATDRLCAPLRGGFLNPLLTAFFLLGLFQTWRYQSSQPLIWVLGTFLFFLLPGFLSLNMDSFRIVQVLPLLLFFTALGIQVVLEKIPAQVRWVILGIVFLFTTGFDTQRLWAPYLDVGAQPGFFLETGKSLARYRAYGILEKLEQTEGPGFVLGEWDIPADRTMEVTTYFFNAALDTRLDPGQVRWAALVTDQHYRPFLEKRFPQAIWSSLDSDFSKDGHRMLGVIPVTPGDEMVVRKWAGADQAFRDLNWGIDHIYDKDCLDRINGDIHADYPLVQGDPFLESAYWEKAAYFYYYYSGHYPEHLRALQLAVQRGYPAAHLYAELAELYTLGGQTDLAQETSRKARGSETEYPWR